MCRTKACSPFPRSLDWIKLRTVILEVVQVQTETPMPKLQEGLGIGSCLTQDLVIAVERKKRLEAA